MALDKGKMARYYIQRMEEYSQSLFRTGSGYNQEIKAFNYAKRMYSEFVEGINTGLLMEVGSAPDMGFADYLINKRRKEITERWEQRRYERSEEVAKASAEYKEMVARNRQVPVDPQQAIRDKEQVHHIEARSRHKVITEKFKEPTMPEVSRIDQKSSRQRAASTARSVKNVDQSRIRTEKQSPAATRRSQSRNKKLIRARDAMYAAKKKRFERTEEPIESYITKKKRARAEARSGLEVKRVRKNMRRRAAAELREGRRAQRAYYKKSPTEKIAMDIRKFAEHAGNMFGKFKDSPIAVRGKTLMANKWFRRGVKGAVGIVAYNLLSNGVKRLVSPKPAIPDYYERGYDVISEQGDFGSPVNLSKTTHKILRPYHSTARKALVTDVNSVIKRNVALSSYKHAIRHTEY